MLLRFFRVNDPYRLLGVLIVMVLLSIPFFVNVSPITWPELRSVVLGEAMAEGKTPYSQLVDSTGPVALYVMGAIDWLFGRSETGRHVIGLLVLFLQASFFGVVLISNRAYNDNNYLPALIFGVLCFWSFDFLSFTTDLLGSSILLFALNNLFKEIEFRIQRDEIILNLGIFLGLSTLVIFSYVVFLFATLIILFLFTRTTVRKIALLIFGFLLPHAILLVAYFYSGHLQALWQYFYLPNFTVGGSHLISLKSLFILGIVPMVYFVFSLFMLQREARFTKYQSQLFQIMFLWLLFAIAHEFMIRELTPQSFILFAPPMSYFIAHYLLLIRRKWIAETMLWLFVAGVMSTNLLARNGKVSSVNYAALFAPVSKYPELKEQRVMMLGNEFEVYRENKMAGFFPDWSMAEGIFREPEYYENILLVYNSLKTDLPEVIIDPHGYLQKFLERIPEWQNLYKKEGELYRKQSAPVSN